MPPAGKFMSHQHIILGSTSVFRKQLLEKLALEFDIATPSADEIRQAGETPSELVRRLSLEKARSLRDDYPDSLIIGSDQVACIDTDILGKPGTHDNARRQLQQASGRQVIFYTGLTLYNSNTGQAQTGCETYSVFFRELLDEQIERYLQQEKPYGCAGSFKSEGLGISLFEKLQGDDPNTLVGLPLIRLIRMLENEGVSVP